MKILNLYCGIGGNRKGYDPLIEPQIIGRHCFWANFTIPRIKVQPRGNFDNYKQLALIMGYNTENWHNVNKLLILRNCVEKEISQHIFKCLQEESHV